MKKTMIIAFLLTSMSFVFFSSFHYNKREAQQHSLSQYCLQPPPGSSEELYKDIFVTLLHPCINKAIENYYGAPLAYDTWDVEVLSIERPKGYRTIGFVIKLQVTPYSGPHIQFGKDNITIRVKANGDAEIEDFQHVESYDYWEYYKKTHEH